MTTAPLAHRRAAVVGQLRAAGCVFAEDEAELLLAAARTAAELAAMVDRRAAGMPLEQVVGWAEFCGLRIAVDRQVFVPRRRTELLAREAVAQARVVSGRRAVVVDLCCGSGAVGAAVAADLAEVELHAVDIDPVAVRCAKRNVGDVGEVYEGDLYDPLPDALRSRVDVLVANTPYVPTDAIALLPAEARDHEPLVALDGGADGLAVQRRMIAAAPAWLAPGGAVLVETSERQLPEVLSTVARTGLMARVARSEELDATVVVATALAT